MFHAALVWPCFTYVSAVCIIAVMLLVLGLIAPSGGKPFDPFGVGLVGVPGAVIVLGLGFGFAAFVVVVYLFARDNDPLRSKFEAFALSIPGLAACFRAFALQRFSMAMHMTIEAGLKADESLTYSFRATTNGAYLACAESSAKQARGGRAVDKILAGCPKKLFPEDYLDTVVVGVITGNLAEVMAKQAEQYRDEAGRKIKFLTMLVGGLVYAMIGLLLIIVIVRMFYLTVIAPINEGLDAIK